MARGPLRPEDVCWVVNNLAELGVRIGDQFFFLYKGDSLVYRESETGPMFWRPVGKREFGECAHPLNRSDPTRKGTVSLDDSPDWQPMPLATSETEEKVAAEWIGVWALGGLATLLWSWVLSQICAEWFQ